MSLDNTNYKNEMKDLFPIENNLSINLTIKQSKIIKTNYELRLIKINYAENIKRYNRNARLKALRNYYLNHRSDILKHQKEKRNGSK